MAEPELESYERPGDASHRWVPVSAIVRASDGKLNQGIVRKRATRREGGADDPVWRVADDELPALVAAGAVRFGVKQALLLRLDLLKYLVPEIYGAAGRARTAKKRKAKKD